VYVVGKPHYVGKIGFNTEEHIDDYRSVFEEVQNNKEFKVFKPEEIPVVSMGCMVPHVMESSSGIEPVYSEAYTRRKACSNIPLPEQVP